MGELELYPRTNWKRALAIVLASVMLAGYGGYRWLTTSTPVDRDQAVAMFRAESSASEEEEVDQDPEGSNGPRMAKSSARSRSGPPKKSASRGETSLTPEQMSGPRTPTAQDGTPRSSRRGQPSRPTVPERPKEGVYSWDTDGWEQAAGVRRDMPRESQRIVTHNSDGSYQNHHYFSEEREIWTQFRFSERGAELMWQRNKVKFGPVTNDSRIVFAPPMVVGKAKMSVGMRWEDSWSGDTSGDYKTQVFEHTTMNIGSETVEVWGIAYDITLRGEQRGTVEAKVWFAPGYSMTVKEHYVQDVEASGGRYQAEWTMTVQSVQPQT